MCECVSYLPECLTDMQTSARLGSFPVIAIEWDLQVLRTHDSQPTISNTMNINSRNQKEHKLL